jgi:hypothetical protein
LGFTVKVMVEVAVGEARDEKGDVLARWMDGAGWKV